VQASKQAGGYIGWCTKHHSWLLYARPQTGGTAVGRGTREALLHCHHVLAIMCRLKLVACRHCRRCQSSADHSADPIDGQVDIAMRRAGSGME
jgi:hypothetical protein